MDMNYLKKHIFTIVKFQALFRGHLARKHTAFIMNSRRVSILIHIHPICSYRLTQDTSLLTKAGRLFLNQDSTIQMPRGRNDRPTSSRQELPSMGSGLVVLETATVFRSGQMVLSTKASGKTTEPTEKESSSILMAISMTGTGSMTKLMVSECTTTSMELCMRDTGETICSMEMAKRAGLTALSTKAPIWLVKSTEWDSTPGMMAANTRVSGLKTRSRGSERIVG